jgi:type III secretion system low calcium response chaperone LcrH/SycD
MNQPAEDHAEDIALEPLASDISQLLKMGGRLGDGWGITDAEREALYQLGHGLYEQARYSDAFKLFSMLVIQNHLEPRYLSALGSTCQMLGRYTDALQHYMAATVIRLDDPRPVFHSAECLIALNRLMEAKESLQLVLTLCGNRHEDIRHRAQALLEALQSKL